MKIDFSRAAEADIAAIIREGLWHFGPEQVQTYAEGLADAFELIAQYPLASPTREELRRQVRVRPYGTHIILYEMVDGVALVLRIRHSHEDWLAE